MRLRKSGSSKTAGKAWRSMAATLFLVGSVASTAAANEPVKIGILKLSMAGPVFIAADRGYFAAEGLNPELHYFTSGQPVAPATVSGDIDFAAIGLTGAFYSLASKGELRIIAGLQREIPGFHTQGIAVSAAAFASGIRSVKDFAGHRFGVSQFGSPAYYSLAAVAEKNGIDLKSIQIVPFQSIPNVLAAVASNQADETILPVEALSHSRQAHIIGWVGDEASFQLGAVFTSTKIADKKAATVKAFLRALRKGMKDYHDAFADAQDHRRDGPTTEAVLRIISKYTGDTPEKLKLGVPFIDAQGRLDVDDIRHQIAWYKEQHIIKGQIDEKLVVDRRYVIPLN
jgi:NitT/TauT family transport system substrate-binding protein